MSKKTQSKINNLAEAIAKGEKLLELIEQIPTTKTQRKEQVPDLLEVANKIEDLLYTATDLEEQNAANEAIKGLLEVAKDFLGD